MRSVPAAVTVGWTRLVGICGRFDQYLAFGLIQGFLYRDDQKPNYKKYNKRNREIKNPSSEDRSELSEIETAVLIAVILVKTGLRRTSSLEHSFCLECLPPLGLDILIFAGAQLNPTIDQIPQLIINMAASGPNLTLGTVISAQYRAEIGYYRRTQAYDLHH